MMSGRSLLAAGVIALLGEPTLAERRRTILLARADGSTTYTVEDSPDVITIEGTPVTRVEAAEIPSPLQVLDEVTAYPHAFWDSQPCLRVREPLAAERWAGYQRTPKLDDARQRARRKAQSKARAITKRNRK